VNYVRSIKVPFGNPKLLQWGWAFQEVNDPNNAGRLAYWIHVNSNEIVLGMVFLSIAVPKEIEIFQSETNEAG
jgi:hypothetical protein